MSAVEKPHIMIVTSRFYPEIADQLLNGAVAAIEKAGGAHEVFDVPGAFEVPAAVQMAVRSMDFVTGRRRFDGYVALGCVIRGETIHFEIVSQESARALQDLACRYTLALGNGILTVDTYAQAFERAAVDRQDKGGEAARACLRMIELKQHFRLYPR
ncbi:MAG: 6,7-dimethyl-8-ribityllumazine synthase [Alphaproteobacteria bacterium]|nr:6,7-dimethyl-8-ribityllumazine synthase [Alphaproteobacteria bacterium]